MLEGRRLMDGRKHQSPPPHTRRAPLRARWVHPSRGGASHEILKRVARQANIERWFRLSDRVSQHGGRGREAKDITRFKLLYEHTMQLAIVHINDPTQSIKDGFDDIVDIALYWSSREIK